MGALLAKLGPRKIIFVGDSLVLEQYLSLEVLTRDTALAGANKTCCSRDAKVSYPGFDLTPGVPGIGLLTSWTGGSRGEYPKECGPDPLSLWHILGRSPEYRWLFWDHPGLFEISCQNPGLLSL